MNYEAVALWSQVISAILFIIVLVWIWFKFLQPAVLLAQQNANAAIAEAERHRDDAKSQLDSLRGEIDAAKRDAIAIKERVEAQAKAECEAIVGEANRAGERTVQNAQGELQRARAAARERLRDELLDQALRLASAQAQDRVDAGMNAQLVGTFLSSLERGGRN